MSNSNNPLDEIVPLLYKCRKTIYKATAFYCNNIDFYHKEEFIGEFLLRICESYPHLTHKKNLNAWIYSLARNTAIYCMTKQNKHTRLFTPITKDIENLHFPIEDNTNKEELQNFFFTLYPPFFHAKNTKYYVNGQTPFTQHLKNKNRIILPINEFIEYEKKLNLSIKKEYNFVS